MKHNYVTKKSSKHKIKQIKFVKKVVSKKIKKNLGKRKIWQPNLGRKIMDKIQKTNHFGKLRNEKEENKSSEKNGTFGCSEVGRQLQPQ